MEFKLYLKYLKALRKTRYCCNHFPCEACPEIRRWCEVPYLYREANRLRKKIATKEDISKGYKYTSDFKECHNELIELLKSMGEL